MKSLFEASHQLWIEAQLRAPGWAQDTILPYLHEMKEALRLRPYLSVQRLRGQNCAGPLVVDYVGLNFEPTLADYLFAEEPTYEKPRRVAAWRAGALGDACGQDLVVVAGSKYLISKLPCENALVLPFFVRMIVDVRGDWQDVVGRVHRSVRNNELRSTRRQKYQYELSHREEDFDLFYHKMYLPTILMRKGDSASPMSRREAYQYFQHGCLLLIERGGHYVAGGLFHVLGRSIKYLSLGAINADQQLIHEGALGACYYSIIRWANQEGYDNVDFGDCMPRLRDGVFHYKRRWGAAIAFSRKVHKQIWIKVQRDTPAVRQFFKDNPFIIVDEDKRLQGLIVADDPGGLTQTTQNEWEKEYATPGLGGPLVRSVRALANEQNV